jgi:4-diphosphocytidyl-2-C-methyl-D-erythritol kinase
MPALPCVLLNPGVPVATRDVFAAIGLKPGESYKAAGAHVVPAWPDGTASRDRWFAAIAAGRNDLEPPALNVQPVIADALQSLRTRQGCQLARMSGSGATCFGLFDDDAAAAEAARRIQHAHPRWWVVPSALS